MEQFLSETVRAASLHFVYLKGFFPLQSQLMSWEFGSLNAEIDCWSSWVIFTEVAGDVLLSCSHICLYGLRMIEAKQQREELNQKLHACNHCLTLRPVRKQCVGAMKSRLISVGLNDSHTCTHTPADYAAGRSYSRDMTQHWNIRCQTASQGQWLSFRLSL